MKLFKETFAEYLNDNEFKRMSLNEQVEEIYNCDLNFKHADPTTEQRHYNEHVIRAFLLKIGWADINSFMDSNIEKLKALQGKSIFLTDDEESTLKTLLRNEFDKHYIGDNFNMEEHQKEIISISEKLDLDKDFINDMKKDLE